MKNIFQTYRKAKSIVLSCDDASQLKAAKKYINLWFKEYTTVDKKGNRHAERLVSDLYEKLLSLMYVKRYELTKHISE